ncbi:putative protein N-methyltransferase FAM86B1 [Plutella xylostella]|uniref:putative protein N-methyltransferase FAM86B1 n=1 Tax=Plutella xylostella TaxID=51655 RepID=UPI002032E6D0|nr:putative protein N-methyltransferase FAM86B1 [Plutella xylostella]
MSEDYSVRAKLISLVIKYYRGSLEFTADDVPPMSWAIQEQFLSMTVYNSKLLQYPVNKNFNRLFCKKLIAFLKTEEIHDDFYTFLCSVMSDPKDAFSFVHYVVDNDITKTIIIRQTNSMVVNGTTGLKTWEAALMLADWALCNPQVFKRKNILELGSGVGFTGIAIAKFCEPSALCLTDHHRTVLDIICRNIEINLPNIGKETNELVTIYKTNNVTIKTLLLDWEYIDDDVTDLTPDVIIGADIVYDPSILQPLCNVFQTYFKKNSQLEIYIESVIRNPDTFKMFVQLLEHSGYKCESLPQPLPVHIHWDNFNERCLLKITK